MGASGKNLNSEEEVKDLQLQSTMPASQPFQLFDYAGFGLGKRLNPNRLEGAAASNFSSKRARPDMIHELNVAAAVGATGLVGRAGP